MAAAAREPFALRLEGGWYGGPWRRPVNNSRHEAGTIHDDATARQLGFAAGPVAGSIHFEQFEPLLQAVFGCDWSAHGSLSLWFDTPAFDGDALQAVVEAGAAPRRRVRLLRADGSQIAHGSASAGVDAQGEVRQRLASQRGSGEPRMLAALRPGSALAPVTVRVSVAEIDRRLPLLTERLPEHEASAGVSRTVPLSTAIHAMRAYERGLPLNKVIGVGLFGAIEWQWLAGPLLAEREVTVNARVLSTATSPRSEMLWTEATMHDPTSGRSVARMLMLSRLLKQGSPLWDPGEVRP
jgi:hypothetical protein